MGYEPDADISGEAGGGRDDGRHVELFHDPREAVDGADVVYADVWTSMGKEAERDAARRASPATRSPRRSWSGGARGDLPPLPARPPWRGGHRRGDRRAGSRVWAQAANRMHTETALLYTILVDRVNVGRPVSGV